MNQRSFVMRTVLTTLAVSFCLVLPIGAMGASTLTSKQGLELSGKGSPSFENLKITLQPPYALFEHTDKVKEGRTLIFDSRSKTLTSLDMKRKTYTVSQIGELTQRKGLDLKLLTGPRAVRTVGLGSCAMAENFFQGKAVSSLCLTDPTKLGFSGEEIKTLSVTPLMSVATPKIPSQLVIWRKTQLPKRDRVFLQTLYDLKHKQENLPLHAFLVPKDFKKIEMKVKFPKK
jgi:hypothetical protein